MACVWTTQPKTTSADAILDGREHTATRPMEVNIKNTFSYLMMPDSNFSRTSKHHSISPQTFFLDIVVASDDGEEVLFTKFKEKDNFMGVRFRFKPVSSV
jgi:hypothetical protein